MATVTPILLGKGVVDTYTGTKGQKVDNADVVYAECGKCGYVNVIYRASFMKRRASIPTAQGKLSVQAFACSRCKAVNSTKGLSVKHLEPYVHTDAPTVQTPTNGTEPTPSDNLTTAIAELVQTMKQHREFDHQERLVQRNELMGILDSIDASLRELLDLWRK